VEPAEPFFKRIAIIGLGLMGGSWALALKRGGFAGRSIGFDRPEVLSRAIVSGAVDEGAADVASAVRGAGLVVLATPVGAILDLLTKLKAVADPQSLITDVGSTKRVICQRAGELLGDAPLFLGGHPLAGKEQSGFEHADPAIFQGAHYALIPSSPVHMNDERVKAFVALVESLGARPYVTSAAEHDLAVAYLSHLPQLVSSALSSLVADEIGKQGFPLELAGSGFRDVTRLAESPYSLWRDICLTNIENIQAALDALIQKLEHTKSILSARELEREFDRARKLRERLREP
jgi:prephenate dehydrogenase